MYISKVGDNYIVKRMPGTARRHAIGCDRFDVLAESYQPPKKSMQTGSSDSSDRVDLRLAFTLTATTSNAEHSSVLQDLGGANQDGRGLSMRGLLHYLWDEAELTRWSPKFEGRRNWGTIYRRLRGAAFNKWVEGDPLLTRLLVPLPFVPAHRAHIWNATHAHLEKLRLDQDKAGLLIAEVKEICARADPPHITFKHLPFLRFQLGHAALAVSRRAIESTSTREVPRRARCIGIATIRVNQDSQPGIVRLHIGEFDDRWLPAGPRPHVRCLSRLSF